MKILLNQSQIARRAGTSFHVVSRAILNGRVKPVAKSPRGFLFDPSDVAIVAEFIKGSRHNVCEFTA
jgi:hypothetical protein